MREYFTNLWLALSNRTPYQKEIAEFSKKLEKANESINQCKEYYSMALDRWRDACKIQSQYEDIIQQLNKEIASYQQLVENLRDSVRVKQDEINEQRKEFFGMTQRMKNDYQKRIEDYNHKIEELSNKQ